MVQIIPPNPGFGSQLATTLAQALGNIGMGVEKGRQNNQDQQILSHIGPDSSPMDIIKHIGGLTPQMQQNLSPLFSHLFQAQGAQQAAASKQNAKVQEQQTKSAQEQRVVQDLSNSIRKKIPYSGTTLFGKGFAAGEDGLNPLNPLSWHVNREAYQNREELNSEGFLYADKVFTKFNKGTITKEKLAYIRDNLAPNSKLSERQNTARLNALDHVLSLPDDASEAEVNAVIKKATGENLSSKGSEKEESSAQLNVYDSSGKLVGTVDKSESKQLPKGYEAR